MKLDVSHGKDIIKRVWESDIAEVLMFLDELQSERNIILPESIRNTKERLTIIIQGGEAKNLPPKT